MKKLKGFEKTVIAGGFVRDNYLGVPYKDVDVFIPCEGQYDFHQKMFAMTKELGITAEFKNMSKYITKSFSGKYDATLDGYDVDFVGVSQPSDGFGYHLMDTFNFGLDMIYTDGEEVFPSKDFEYDTARGLIRLINCTKMGDLPHIMEKYARLKAKYPSYEFTSDLVLEQRKGTGWV